MKSPLIARLFARQQRSTLRLAAALPLAVALLGGVAVLPAAADNFPFQRYRVHALGNFTPATVTYNGYTHTDTFDPVGLLPDGTVVGNFYHTDPATGSRTERAATFVKGTITLLLLPSNSETGQYYPNNNSQINSVASNGLMAGSVWAGFDSLHSAAIRWSPNGDYNDSIASRNDGLRLFGVNASGIWAGEWVGSFADLSSSRALSVNSTGYYNVTSNPTLRLNHRESRALRINDAGQLIGEVYNDNFFSNGNSYSDPYGYQAVIFGGTATQSLGSLPGYANSVCVSQNERGVIVGTAFNGSRIGFSGDDFYSVPFVAATDSRAFVYRNGSLTPLQVPANSTNPNAATQARGIDDTGRVLFESSNSSYSYYPDAFWIQTPLGVTGIGNSYMRDDQRNGFRFDVSSIPVIVPDGEIVVESSRDNSGNIPVLSLVPVSPKPILSAPDYSRPVTITMGDQSPTITLTGDLFRPESVAYVNGTPRPTTFVSPTQLSVQLNTSDAAAAGSITVQVGTPANPLTANDPQGPDGGLSNTVQLPVYEKTAKAISVTPNHSPVLDGGVTVAVHGENFIPGQTRFYFYVVPEYAAPTTYSVVGDATISSDASSTDGKITIPAYALQNLYSLYANSAGKQIWLVPSNAGQNPGSGEAWQDGNSVQFFIDATAMSISNLASKNVSTTGATLAWNTNLLADGKIEYGKTADYGTTVSEDQYATETAHSAALSGLDAGTLYYYRVTSADAPNGQSATATGTFVTTSQGKPNVSVSGVSVSRSGAVTASITLTNGGTAPATGVQLTEATLGGTATTTTLPASLGTIAAGATGNTFAAFAARPAGNTTLHLAGTYDGGTFSVSIRVRVP